jgi:hypothetical protein
MSQSDPKEALATVMGKARQLGAAMGFDPDGHRTVWDIFGNVATVLSGIGRFLDYDFSEDEQTAVSAAVAKLDATLDENLDLIELTMKLDEFYGELCEIYGVPKSPYS